MNFLKTRNQINNDNLGSVNESVFKKGDIWGVKTVVEIPKSLINAFVSKAKKEHGIDPKEQWGDSDIAELLVKYVTTTFMNIESLPIVPILGEGDKNAGQVQTDVQPEENIAAQTPEDINAEPQAPAQVQVDVEAQAQQPSAEIQNEI